MAQLHSKYVNGNLVYYAIREDKWIDAVGMTVRKYFEDFTGPTPVGADNADPLGWTLTNLTGDAGDSSMAVSNEAGGALVITTDDTENDGINVSVNNEAFTLASGDPIYFGVRLKVSDADATDLIVGLTIGDLEMWGGFTDGIYYESADAVATCTFVTEKDSSETSDTAAGTLVDDTYSELEFYYDGVGTVKAYFDNELVATSTTTIPDDEPLKFSLELLTGEGNTNTCSIDWIRIIQCQ
jgi:hypothetical protein